MADVTKFLDEAGLAHLIGSFNTKLKSKADSSVIDKLNGTTKKFTLLAANWSNGQYTVRDDLISIGSIQFLNPGTDITIDQLSAFKAAEIIDAGQRDGSLTLKALGTVPTIDIPIRITFSTIQGINNVTVVDHDSEDALIMGTLSGNYENNRIARIRDSAFAFVTGLTSFKSNSVTEIGFIAFEQCPNLADVYAKALTTIGDYAFEQCANLTTVDSETITTIGEFAFSGCSKLTSINTSKVKTFGGGAFENCSSLKDIDLSSAEKIDDYAFNGCLGLIDVSLPNIKTIIGSPFKDCSNLKSITIGTNASTKVVPAEEDEFGYGLSFSGAPIASGSGYIYVADSLVDAYKAADGWSKYKDQIKGISEKPA